MGKGGGGNFWPPLYFFEKLLLFSDFFTTYSNRFKVFLMYRTPSYDLYLNSCGGRKFGVEKCNTLEIKISIKKRFLINLGLLI